MVSTWRQYSNSFDQARCACIPPWMGCSLEFNRCDIGPRLASGHTLRLELPSFFPCA
jgi:hypothetical protein